MKIAELKAVIAAKNEIINKETEKINKCKERIKAAKAVILQTETLIEDIEAKELLASIKQSGVSVGDVKAYIKQSKKPEEVKS